MEDIYLKIGLLVIALLLIGLLAGLALKASSNDEFGDEQSAEGDNSYAFFKIQKLCKACISEYDRDCFILNLRLTKGELELEEAWFLQPGDYVLRIASSNNSCVVSQVG